MMKGKCKYTWCLTMTLMIIGAINWGLVGLGGFLGSDLNVVNMLLGAWPKVEWVVYILVGLSGLYIGGVSLMCKGKESCCGTDGKC